jgi:hypothetical protein
MDFIVKRNWDAYNELVREPQAKLAYSLTPSQRLERCCELYAMSRAANDDSEEYRKMRIEQKKLKIEHRRKMIPLLLKLNEVFDGPASAIDARRNHEVSD